MATVRYQKGAEHPDLTFVWRATNGAVLDLSVGYTFELKIGTPGQTAVFTKTTGIVGGQTAPNITIGFFAEELAPVPPGLYVGQLRARATASSQDRYLQFWFYLTEAIN